MGPSRLEALTAAIDDPLALDPADLDGDELHDAVVGLQRQSHRWLPPVPDSLAVGAEPNVAGDGSRSAGHRLAREASLSVQAAKREVRRAVALLSMPHRDALAAGEFSPQHVDLLAGANSGARSVVFESHEQTLVEQAKLLRFADCYRMIEYWKQHADAAATEDEGERRHEAPRRRWRSPSIGWSTCAPCSTPSPGPRSCPS